MGFMDTAASWRDKFKLGPHHRTERFAVTMGSLAVVGTLLIGATSYSAYQSNQEDLSNTSIYTASYTSSLTETTGEVAGVYTNEKKTRALLLLEFDNPDTPGFSMNAENYSMYLTGSKPNMEPEDVATNMSGNLIMFGSTGYMGVVLSSDEPFEEQILNLTIRNSSEAAVGDGNVEDALDMGDSTFERHDQWRLFFNPGASGVQTLESFGDRGLDVESLYAEMVLHDREVAVQAAMDRQLLTMQRDLAVVSELEDQLVAADVDGVAIIPPELPEEIYGDMVVGELGEDVESDVLDPEAHIDNETPITTYPDSTLALESDWVDPRGYDFNWRDGSIVEGYLDDMVPSSETYYSFLENKANGIASGDADDAVTDDDLGVYSSESNSDSAGSFDANALEWVLNDAEGTDLSEQQDHQPGLQPLVNVMNNLSSAYQTYFDNKVLYQVELYGDLLELELELASVSSEQSVHADEDALLVY